MRRNKIVLIIVLSLLFVLSLEYASAEKISWVIENWDMSDSYYPLIWPTTVSECKLHIHSRVIKTLDLSTGVMTEVEIPSNWIPIRSYHTSDGLYFAVENTEHDGRRIDIYCWRGDSDYSKCDEFYVESSGEPYMYYDHKLYLKSFKAFENTDICPETYIYLYEDTFVEKYNVGWDINNWGIEYITMSGDIISLDSTSKDNFILWKSYNDKLISASNINVDSKYPFRIMMGPDYKLAQKEDSLLFFLPLDTDIIPTIQISTNNMEEYDGGNVYNRTQTIPLYSYMQLFCLNITDGVICDYLDESSRPIRIKNMEVVSDTIVNNKNTLFFVAKDFYNGIDDLDGFEELINGRTMLIALCLDSGAINILYETGYTKPDFTSFASFWVLQFLEDAIGEDYYEDALKTVTAKITNMKEREIPLEINRNGVMSFFPDNFSVFVHD